MSNTTGPTATGTLTRSQVAEQLCKSVSAVRRMEGQQLHPIKSDGGQVLFDAAEVEELRQRTGTQAETPLPEPARPEPSTPPPAVSVPAEGSAEGRDHRGPEPTATPAASGREGSATTEPAMSKPAPAADPTSVIFGDLNAGQKLCHIVANRGFAPDVVLRAHEQWVRLAQIDTLTTPAGERRLLGLETGLDGQKSAVDILNGNLFDVRQRLDEIERRLGIPTEDEEFAQG